MSPETPSVTRSDIRLARALVNDARKRGEREDPRIEKIARLETGTPRTT
ncbi:hypothetical protein [Allobranchiibius sp. CTAmp26]|nr:hypothetical protein [Allobranchiibius sp. CTAmp26]MBO1756054.1 hypothetical protein [Allobranchiibius sp. CTAmp26]